MSWKGSWGGSQSGGGGGGSSWGGDSWGKGGGGDSWNQSSGGSVKGGGGDSWHQPSGGAGKGGGGDSWNQSSAGSGGGDSWNQSSGGASSGGGGGWGSGDSWGSSDTWNTEDDGAAEPTPAPTPTPSPTPSWGKGGPSVAKGKSTPSTGNGETKPVPVVVKPQGSKGQKGQKSPPAWGQQPQQQEEEAEQPQPSWKRPGIVSPQVEEPAWKKANTTSPEEGKGTQGKGMESKGLPGKGMEAKGLPGKTPPTLEPKTLPGKGMDAKGMAGKGMAGKGMEAAKGVEGKGSEGKGMEGKATEGKGMESKGMPTKGLVKGKGAVATPAPKFEPKIDQAPVFKAKVERFTKEMESTEKLANSIIERAKKTGDDEKATVPALKSVMESLEKQQTKVSELTDTLSKDTDEARKAGITCKDHAQELQKLLIKTRALLQQIVLHANKLKPKHAKAQQDQEIKAKEIKDAAAFKPVLSKVTKDVANVDDAVATLSRKAKLIIAKPPEGEELDRKCEPIVNSANEAMKKHETVRTEIQEKSKGAQQYAPEAKKTAMQALAELQKKMTESLKMIKVYQNFKKELPKLAEGQKALTEVTEKLTGHDAAILKASKLAEKKDLTKENVTAIEEITEPVVKAVQAASAIIVQKSRVADEATKVKLQEMKVKGDELKKKVDAVATKIKGQKDVFNSVEAIEVAKEHVEKAEAGIKQYQDAEMPFLTGVEVLDPEESERAFKECQEAITATGSAVQAARNWLKTKLNECKTYEKELSEQTNEQLMPLNTKIQTIDQNLTKIRKEMSERKMGAVMSGAVDAAIALEKKIKAVEVEAKLLKSTSLEEEDPPAIKEVIEKTRGVLSEATAAENEAKKVLAQKSREAKAAQNDPTVVKIKTRIDAGSAKLNAVKQAMGTADKVIRTKAAIATGEERVKEAETETEKAKKAAAKQLTVESIGPLDEALNAARKVVNVANGILRKELANATPKAKEALQELLERNTASGKTLDELKADTKDAREDVLSESFMSKAEANTKAVEDAVAKLEEAEMPFLTGSDPELKQRLESIAQCEEGLTAVKAALDAATKFNAQKTVEIKHFGDAIQKTVKDTFAAMAERTKKISAKIPSFDKDLKERTKAARLVEASAKVDDFEAQVKKVVALAEPFKQEGADKWSEQEAAAPLKAFMDADKELKDGLVALKGFVRARTQDFQGKTAELDTIKQLQDRLTKGEKEVLEARKPTQPHEQASLGTRLLAEAKGQVGALEGEVKKATDVCAPLLEAGGAEFLVKTSMSTLAAALRKDLKAKDQTVQEMWKEIGKGKTMLEKSFVAFLTGLSETHDEVSAFTEERRSEIAKRLCKDGKSIKAADFQSLFVERYSCVKAVAMTQTFEIEEGTVCKVEPGTEVELSGAPKEDEAGMLRSECKLDDKSGWITIKQKPQVVFLSPVSAYKSYTATVDAAITECSTAIQKTTGSLTAKLKQGGAALDGPLKAAREEMAKLKEDITKAQKELEELKKKVANGRRDYAVKERSEVNAHIEIRNAKEAAPFLEDPKAKVEAVEAIAQTAEEAGSPLAALSGEELQAFATPATVYATVEKGNADIVAKATEARETIKAQVKAATEKTPQSGGTNEAKKQLTALSKKVEDAVRKTSAMLAKIRAKCKFIVDPKYELISEAIRKDATSKNLSGEALFNKLKTDDKITEESFCRLVEGLKDDRFTTEIAKLVCRKVEAGGISKEGFLKFVVVYFKVVKSIAFTDVQDISKCKTIRKVETEEVLEMLEGPLTDEGSGLTRIRAKALKGGTEGWVTVSGSQGTAFMEKCEKPKEVEKKDAK